MLLKPDATSEERISNWLEGYSEEIIRGNSTNEADVGVFLEILQDYVSSTKVRFI